jgi:hypothetical protein
MYRSPLVWKSVIVATCAVLTTTAAANAGTSTPVGARSKGRPEARFLGAVPTADLGRKIAFVGLKLEYARWQHSTQHADTTIVDTGIFDLEVSADVLRINWIRKHIENPYDWSDDTWTGFWSLSQMVRVGSTASPNSNWKWSSPLFIPKKWRLSDGSTVLVNGQPFKVTGPVHGFTDFGMPYDYWQLRNTRKFLWYSKGNRTFYVLPGDAVLRYDAGGRRIITYSEVTGAEYVRGQISGNSMQNGEHLTDYSPGWEESTPTTQGSPG